MIATFSLYCMLMLGPEQQANPRITPPNPVQAMPYVDADQDAAGAEAASANPDPGALAVGDEPADPPKFWIGVHVVPIPEPLAAHLGKDGLMVMNIVKDGPADKAGLERYDVVRSFNGKPIHEMSDLVNAIQESNQKLGNLEIVRGGKASTLKLAAVARPDTASVEYKYEDPETAQAAPQGGRALRIWRDPTSGSMQMEPFGALAPIPPATPFLPDQNWRAFIEPFLNGMDTWAETDDGSESDDSHAQVEVRVQTNNNGEKLSIHRSPDGKVEVERTDANGKTDTKIYDNVKAFREGDKEAFDVYRRSAGHGRMSIQFSPGSSDEWKQRHADIQAEIQKQLEAVHQRMNDAQPAPPVAPATPRGAGSKATPSRRMRALSSSVSVEDGGKVHVTISENGKTQQYDFANVEELKEKEPQLYEKVKAMLEQKGAMDWRMIAAA